MNDLRGFYVHIGNKNECLTIENTQKDGHVTFIESNGTTKFDLSNEKFIELANFLKHEADLIKEQMKMLEPEVSVICTEVTNEEKEIDVHEKREAI